MKPEEILDALFQFVDAFTFIDSGDDTKFFHLCPHIQMRGEKIDSNGRFAIVTIACLACRKTFHPSIKIGE
jgi:hypothetical protein